MLLTVNIKENMKLKATFESAGYLDLAAQHLLPEPVAASRENKTDLVELK
jgi:hypothetical protein